MLQIHEKIEQARVSAGLTQDQMAEKLGIKRSTYQYWEKKTPGIDKIKQVAKVLSLPNDYFLGRSDENFVSRGIAELGNQPDSIGALKSLADGNHILYDANRTLADSNKNLSEANKKLADAHMILAEGNKELIQIMKTMVDKGVFNLQAGTPPAPPVLNPETSTVPEGYRRPSRGKNQKAV